MDSGGLMDAEIEDSLSKIRGELASLEAHLGQLNLQRKQALNDYLDLKGNIRVFCRVRPLISDEKCDRSRSVIATDSSNVFLKITDNKSKRYSFDNVFHPQSTQEQVFSEIEPVIKSTLDGYNVCIFAYGQTGTGKTYTMEGRPNCPGVVPRGIEALFEQALESNYKLLFTFSMLEIYMGSLIDLLVPRSTKPRVHKAPRLSIQMDHTKGGIEIENLVAVEVSDFEQVMRLYKQGSRLRSTASTMSNFTSSRSHCLIRISLSCLNAPERRRERNKIWMVDLGGSERMLKTQARGRRLEEGKAINLSLSALGDVISSLQSKKKHVPYRNSKLTQVLRDSLGSDSKNLMLVHVSPREEDMCETVCSLGFATRVGSIHLGSEETIEMRAKKEVAMAEMLQKVNHLDSEHQDVRRNIERLDGRLKHLQGPETLSDCQLKTSILSTEGMQSNGADTMKSARNPTGASANLPRFMRPTVCSQHKTIGDHQTYSRKKPPVPLKRRKSSSVYADSVASQAKGGVWLSDYGSECSISTINYLNRKYSADDGSECSWGTSEYDIKNVMFPENEKSPRSLMTTAHESVDKMENGQADNTDQIKQLTIENWIHIQMTDQNSSYGSKRILAIPANRASNKCGEQNHGSEIYKVERQHCASTRNPGTSKKEHMNASIEEEFNFYGTVSEAMMIEKYPNKTIVNEKHTSLVGASSEMTDGEYHQNKDLDRKFKLIPECQQALVKDTKETDVGSDSSTVQTATLVSRDNTISKNIYNEDLHWSQQHNKDAEETWLRCVKSRRSLFMEKDLPTRDQKNGAFEDPIVPVNNFQEKKHISGTHQLLLQILQMLWASVLLGLGIHSFGFGHDFFHGLMF